MYVTFTGENSAVVHDQDGNEVTGQRHREHQEALQEAVNLILQGGYDGPLTVHSERDTIVERWAK